MYMKSKINCSSVSIFSGRLMVVVSNSSYEIQSCELSNED